MLLRTLGGLELPATSFFRPKALLLLAYLALEGPKERRHLAELFWLGATDPLNRLAVTLSRLRHEVPGSVGTEEARVSAKLQTDAQKLLTAFEERNYERVVELCAGQFLEGVSLTGCSTEFEEWVYGTRDVLAEQAKVAQLALAEVDASRGRFQEAAKRAELAFRVAQTAGFEPSELRRMHTLLLADDHPQSFTVRREAEGFDLTLFSSSAEARESLLAAYALSQAVPNNLSASGRSFVGRDLELAELATMLTRPELRLVSIVGPGGIGKTHLGLEVARRQVRAGTFTGGVYFVPLDALSSGDAVPAKVAETVGLVLHGGEAPSSQIARHLGRAASLLVLDNLEHILAAGLFLSELLEASPKLKVLLTSRERLNLKGEWLFALGGLNFGSAQAGLEHLRGYEAIRLFVERARQVQVGFNPSPEELRVIQRIAALVEGSPLGLELAANWVRLMSCAEIAEELQRNLDFLSDAARDVPDRQRSLRAAFEHSWRLLGDTEQNALAQLSVFRGGFTRDAAAEVAGATIPILASLVDKSLLRVSERGRYDRHPLIYQYTQEKLAEQPEERAEAEARHAAYFSALSERLKLEHDGAEPGKTYARLEAELENFRATWRWAITHKSAETFDACGSVFVKYFWKRWRGDESVQLWMGALAALDETNPAHQATVAGLLGRLGLKYVEFGRLDEAEALAERGLALLRPLQEGREDLGSMFLCLLTLASVAQLRGQFRQAKAYLLEQEALGVVRSQGRHLTNLGVLETHAGNYKAAQDYLRRALEHSRNDNNLRQLTRSLDLLGDAHLHAGEAEAARGYYREAVALMRKHGPIEANDSLALLHLGEAALELGEVQEAQRAAREILEKHPDHGRFHAQALKLLGRTARATGDYHQAESYFRQSIEETLEHFGGFATARPGEFSDMLLDISDLRLKQGRYQEAAALLGFLQPHLHDASKKAVLVRLLSELQTVLPSQTLERALSEGAGLELEAILRDILAETVPNE